MFILYWSRPPWCFRLCALPFRLLDEVGRQEGYEHEYAKRTSRYPFRNQLSHIGRSYRGYPGREVAYAESGRQYTHWKEYDITTIRSIKGTRYSKLAAQYKHRKPYWLISGVENEWYHTKKG